MVILFLPWRKVEASSVCNLSFGCSGKSKICTQKQPSQIECTTFSDAMIFQNEEIKCLIREALFHKQYFDSKLGRGLVKLLYVPLGQRRRLVITGEESGVCIQTGLALNLSSSIYLRFEIVTSPRLRKRHNNIQLIGLLQLFLRSKYIACKHST